MKKNGFFSGPRVAASLLSPLFLLTACGQAEPDSDGMITFTGNQLQVLRSKAEQDALCKVQYCEPNYLLYASFGRRRGLPPVSPRPTPRPTNPAPAEPDPVSPAKEVMDQAKVLMNTASAWRVSEGSPDIVVAVIDSGTNLSHPDLQANLWTNAREQGGAPGQDNDGNGYASDLHGYDFYAKKGDPEDENGHGTHTAGTIAALKNGMGVIGVAPNVKVMPLRFLGPQGQGSTADAILAIRYAVKMGARVISASWGGPGFSSYLAQAVQEAVESGVIFVAAAGNDGMDLSRMPTYPASLPGVITVASSGLQDQLSNFSNYDPNTVLVSAPGEQILSTFLKGGYKALSGTSMATPQVSGAIALALSKNKSVMPNQLKAVLCNTADPLRSYGTRCGRINIGRFIQSL